MLQWVAAVLAAWLIWLFYENVWPGLYKQYYLWHIPQAPAHPLIGHVGQLLATNWRSFRLMQKWDLQYGPIFVMRFLWSPVSHPQHHTAAGTTTVGKDCSSKAVPKACACM
jgi:hypothetical protein